MIRNNTGAREILATCLGFVLLASGASTLSRADTRNHVDEYASAVTNAQMRNESGDTYAEALMNELHWGHFPIRIAFTNSLSSDREKLDEIVQQGFNQWVKATQDEVKYEVVSSPARADVTVTYEVVPNRPFTGGKLGTTGFNYNKTRRQLFHADMHLNVWEGMTRRDLERFANTAAHEFGHALGINGHSPNPDDLMYFTSSQSEGVTARDLNTLRQAYGGFARKTTVQNTKKAAKSRS